VAIIEKVISKVITSPGFNGKPWLAPSSAQGVAFTAGENQSISGLRFLKMYDADGVEVSRIQYGFSTTGQTTTRTIPIEPASVVQVMTAGAYDTNAALSIGVTSSTSSGLAIIQNFADVEVANNFSLAV